MLHRLQAKLIETDKMVLVGAVDSQDKMTITIIDKRSRARMLMDIDWNAWNDAIGKMYDTHDVLEQEFGKHE